MARGHGMARWRGEVALVTGASAGIGEAIAEALVADGLKVAVAARRGARLDALAHRLRGEYAGAQILAVPTDLRDPLAITALFETVRAEWGGVRVMVNNAGLGRAAPLMSGATEAWREMLDVNVLALCVCTREAVSDMRAAGDRGHVVHVSSMSAYRVPEGSGVYSATKFAVRALTEGLRKELREAGSAVRVSAVSPGNVETEFAAVLLGDEALAAQQYASYKCLEPADVAEAVRYALSAPEHAEVHDVLMRPTAQPT